MKIIKKFNKEKYIRMAKKIKRAMIALPNFPPYKRWLKEVQNKLWGVNRRMLLRILCR